MIPPDGHRLCRLDELADGRSRGFDPLDEGRDTMFVVRRGDAVFGYRNACPHIDGARMAWRRHEYLDAEATHIRCAAHGALFGIADGRCVIGPCVGEMLTPVPLAVVNGDVWQHGLYARGPRNRAGGNGTARAPRR